MPPFAHRSFASFFMACLVGWQDESFTIHGMADLEDVCTSLAFQQVNEDDLKEFGTLSGYLCSQAGEIPAVGDYVVVGGYMFTVTKVRLYCTLPLDAFHACMGRE